MGLNVSPIYIPNFIPPHVADYEFTRLWNTLDWERREGAPRREYWQNNYNLPYTYGQGAGIRTYDSKPWDTFVRSAMLTMNELADWILDCCFINGYEDERDSLGWHADDSPEMNNNQPIISLSLGGERDIEIRHNETGEKTRFRLGHGSIFVMPPGFQQSHQHRIPKAGFKVGPRVSLTYRAMVF